VIKGYQGMPAMVGCFRCAEDDLRLLIGFVTGVRLQQYHAADLSVLRYWAGVTLVAFLKAL
jgi:hypothetical protein